MKGKMCEQVVICVVILQRPSVVADNYGNLNFEKIGLMLTPQLVPTF